MSHRGFLIGILLVCLVGTAVFIGMINSTHAVETDTCIVPSASHATIQAAVNDTACSTIELGAMSYLENILIDRELTINGQSAEETIIDGNEAGRVFQLGMNAVVTMTEMTIQGGLTYLLPGAGIYNAGYLRVSECTISNNTASDHYGGGIYNSSNATMLVENSAIIDNQATFSYGSGVNNAGTMYIENVTISGNHANPTGGAVAISEDGEILISNATITNNYGGGIFGTASGSGRFEIQNSIVSGNFKDNSGLLQDCAYLIISQGHNLIGTSADCDFQTSDGDLMNVSPNLDLLAGNPPYHPLLMGPGIDVGDPNGCEDHTGSLLLTDQRGESRHRRCDIGAYEYDDSYYTNYLPICLNNYCSDFLDDFSNPNSGWFVGDDPYVRSEYLNGEFRILTKQSGYVYLYSAPTCGREYYTTGVDVHWTENSGAEYGLLMGIMGDFETYYFYTIVADYQEFGLFKRTSSGWQPIVDYTPHNAIHTGISSNHLEAIYLDGDITLKVNEVTLGTWSVGYASQLTWTGIAASPYNNVPTADARFDNFFVKTAENDLQATNTNSLSLYSESVNLLPPQQYKEIRILR